MEFMNIYAILVAAIVPIILGFIWYNPKVFGIAWMRASGMTEEKMKKGNMPVIFIVSLILSVLLAFSVNGMTIHQVSATQLAYTNPDAESFLAFINEFKSAHRTFGHGALHGAFAGIFFVLPILGINGMFERQSWKHIFINVGYWTVCLAIMGAIVCGWV